MYQDQYTYIQILRQPADILGRPFLIGISGPSGVGKTSFASTLAVTIDPENSLVLQEDDYFHDMSFLSEEEANSYNFDDASARDHASLSADLNALSQGRAIQKRSYDFKTRKVVHWDTCWDARDFAIVEGNHLFLSTDVCQFLDIMIYLDAPADVRLARRIVRDLRERGRSTENIIHQYFAMVRPMQLRHQSNMRKLAHIVVFDKRASARSDVTALDVAYLVNPLFDYLKKFFKL
jgi:uridine kinase